MSSCVLLKDLQNISVSSLLRNSVCLEIQTDRSHDMVYPRHSCLKRGYEVKKGIKA